MNVDLHPWQARIHQSLATNRVIEAARRGGKSRGVFWVMYSFIQDKMKEPVSVHLQPPLHIWIVCPTFPQSNQVWTELMAFIPKDWMSNVNQEYKQIRLKGMEGGRTWGLIEVKSAHDPDSLQTAGLDFLWVTEAQDIQNAAFDKMSPMLHSPDRKLTALWEGIPSLWRDHWFWRLCEFAANERNKNYEYFHWTFYDNPMLSDLQRDEIELEREVMTDAAWKRMYLAERTESAGFFKNIDQAIGGDMLSGPLPGARYVAGLDLGRKIDASVLWILDAQERKGIYHQSWDAGEDWAQQREGVVHACNVFGVSRLYVDATGMGGDMFTQALAESGIPVEEYIFTEPTRLHLLNQLAVALERYTTTFPQEPTFIRQLRAFQFLAHGGGKPRPDHPAGEHDDEIMAYGLGLLLCDEGSPESARSGRGGRMSYFPEGGKFASNGAQMMNQRKVDRMRDRITRAGVNL